MGAVAKSLIAVAATVATVACDDAGEGPIPEPRRNVLLPVFDAS